MGMPKTVQKLHKETNQDLIADEVEAIEGYDRAIDQTDNPEAIDTYEHIKGEEEEHIAELQGLDKMRIEEVNSEQAWEDFKAGYSDFEEKHIGKDREGDKASLEEKIDVMSAKLSELNTDMSRLTDSVPQALGTIEESKTLEDEAEEEQEGEELSDEMGEEGGDEDFFGGDDGLDELFADDGEGEEETSGEGDASDGEDVDADGVSDEDEGKDEDIAESDEEVNDTEIDEDPSEDGESDEGDSDDGESDDESDGEDDDFISMDEIMADDEEESDDESKEEPDERESEDEDKKKDEDDVLEKMVKVLEKMDRRISVLERENAGLKKQLSDMNKVQTEPRNVAKSRPRPNTNLQLVKGSYHRPPVSTQYVANQRDIGIGKKTESTNNSVFRQGLNEVFENCERIANQTRY